MSSSAVSPALRSMRMSSGPSARKLMPRAGVVELHASSGRRRRRGRRPRSRRCVARLASSSPKRPWSEARRGRRSARAARCDARARPASRSSADDARARAPRGSPRRGRPRRAWRRRRGRRRAARAPGRPGSRRTVTCGSRRGRRGARGQAHGDDVLDVHRRNCSIAVLKLASSASLSVWAACQRSCDQSSAVRPMPAQTTSLASSACSRSDGGTRMRPCLSSSHSTAAERYSRRKATTFGVELRHLGDLRLELLPGAHRVEVQAAVEEGAGQRRGAGRCRRRARRETARGGWCAPSRRSRARTDRGTSCPATPDAPRGPAPSRVGPP